MPHDPHRPTYHFSSGQWMNDPIPFYWNGAYHIFFQYNPNGAFWGTMHWGHAVSQDLLQWRQLPIALAPTPGGPDADGCFTGCAVEEGGRLILLYTGIPRLTPLQQVQCLATSTDGVTWEKPLSNPVIAEQPPGFGECFRDPCAWKEGDLWYLVIGSELPEEQGGAALLYRSPDLFHWEYLHPLFIGDAAKTGRDFECPDFFPLGDRHVLLTSRGHTHWHIGRYADHRFTLEGCGLTDGGALYAAKTLLDGHGRRILWGWVQERRPEAEQCAAGWSGVLSLPRLLTLREDGALGIEPVPELTALRGQHRQFRDLTLTSDRPLLLEGVSGAAIEIVVRFAPSPARRLGALARCSPDLTDRVEVIYNRDTHRLAGAPLELSEGEELVLHLFIDHSVIEAFANSRACHTVRCYPERSDCLMVGLLAQGGEAKVESVDVWELQPPTQEQYQLDDIAWVAKQAGIRT